MSAVSISHIWLDERNVAWIDQTNMKVIEIALERLAHGSSVEEIVEQHRGLTHWLRFMQLWRITTIMKQTSMQRSNGNSKQPINVEDCHSPARDV